MTISKYLRILLLALYWKLPSAKEVGFSQVTEVSKELNQRREKRKRLKKRRDRLTPKQTRLIRHQGYKSAKKIRVLVIRGSSEGCIEGSSEVTS